MATVAEDLLKGLEGFSGQLLRPGDSGYEEARRIHNGLIDKRPALIARCLGVADVVAAVDLARDNELELSVRGGGHNVAGRAVTDGGLMIDLSLMKGIHVNPAERTARAQGGVTWAELNRETQLHGLAVTGGAVSSTGIAGLTLGGGLGFAMAKHGLAVDSLLSAEVVTADGRVLTASETENGDLFWALRGGGGNFGVVTSFEYRVHPTGPTITGGAVIHSFEAAGEMFRFYREFTAGMSDDLVVYAGLLHAPDGSGAPLCGMVLCHVGPLEQAQTELEPLLAFGSPIDAQVGPMPYTVVNTLFDPSFPTGALNYWKSSFVRELSNAAIDTMLAQFTAAPSPMTNMVLEPVHGAVTRVPVDATAVPHRDKSYNLVITAVWMDPAATNENIAWTRGAFAALQPYLADRRYVNYMPDDETGEDVVRAAYGPNYDRLVELKTKYDPTNLFRLNQNIEPRAIG
jgi:FAD/FMN-containing dehydrogenase